MTVRDLRLDTWDGSGIGVHYTNGDGSGDNNTILSVEQWHTKADGMNGGGQKGLKVTNCYVHDSGESPYFHNMYWRRWVDPVISGSRFDNSRSCGVKMSWGDNLQFTSNQATGNVDDGLITQHTAAQPNTLVYVTNSTFTGNKRGVAYFGNEVHVNGCTSNSNVWNGFYIGGGGGDMYNNNACGNASGQSWADYDVHGAVLYKGVTYNNKKCGVVIP
jgi:hypothetical protein